MGCTEEREVTGLIRSSGFWLAELRYAGDEAKRPLTIPLLKTIKFKDDWGRLLLVKP